MKKLIFLLSFLALTGISYSQSKCKKFKTGHFENIDNGKTDTYIERNDSIQIEKSGDKIIKLRVKWIDDCSYCLIFLEGNEAFWKARGYETPTPDLIVKITEIKKKSYLQEAKFEGDDEFVYKSEIKKVK